MPLNESELGTRIDALLRADDFGREQWYTAGSATPFEMTFKFETAKAADFPWDNVADPVAYGAADQAAIRAALTKFEAVLNVRFVEAPDDADPVLSFYRSPDLYTDSASSGGGRGRWRYQGEEWDGHVVFRDVYDLSAPGNTDLVMHEIGHALGLKHPGNYDVGGTGAVGPYLPADEDNNKNTVMSYSQNPDTGTNATDLMVYDIAALQKWWGVNGDTNAGKTSYRALEYTELRVIYDAGGRDWIRYDGTGKARIDLREGAFSSLDGLDVAAIAYGTVIENAASGSAGDRLIGNAAGNILKGGAGRDNLLGGKGADVLKGGQGGDWLVAGKGADKLTGGKGADHFVFNGAKNEGRNVIRDFADGRDMIRIKGLAFEDLAISSAGTNGVNTKLVLDGMTEIVLKGVDSSLITTFDFDFV